MVVVIVSKATLIGFGYIFIISQVTSTDGWLMSFGTCFFKREYSALEIGAIGVRKVAYQ